MYTLFSLSEEFVAVRAAYLVESGFQQLASLRQVRAGELNNSGRLM